MPKDKELKKVILDEAHNSRYIIHLGATKMYQNFKRILWCSGRNKDVKDYV